MMLSAVPKCTITSAAWMLVERKRHSPAMRLAEEPSRDDELKGIRSPRQHPARV
jgi:hypothetical protein